jgi:hypothetical protein
LQGIQGPAGPKGETGLTGPTGPAGQQGAAGAAGKSAYEFARDGGYTGNLEEFAAMLASLGNLNFTIEGEKVRYQINDGEYHTLCPCDK